MTSQKILGVIEGFYGTPWSHDNRLACIDFISQSGWNTYVWAAKLEPRHRDQWNEPFTSAEIEQFAELSHRQKGVTCAVGLTPGDSATSEQIIGKLTPAINAGCQAIALCFDDLPVLHAASQHQLLANAVANHFAVPVWIVPTHYAGTNASAYLTALCTGLHPDIEVMWTGPTVVTDSISWEDAVTRASVTGGRQPLVWDNTPVNDARMRQHLHLGPFSGRDVTLLAHCSGFLWNPMEEFEASLPTLVSAAAWSHGEDPIAAWNEYVNNKNLLLIAEATAYPTDAHWPGDQPSREWWLSIRDLAVEDEQLRPWVESAKKGAQLALASLHVITAEHELTQKERNLILFQLMGWADYQSQQKKTFGSGPRTRPIATQDSDGRFVLLPSSIEEHESLVDSLVRQALRLLRG